MLRSLSLEIKTKIDDNQRLQEFIEFVLIKITNLITPKMKLINWNAKSNNLLDIKIEVEGCM